MRVTAVWVLVFACPPAYAARFVPLGQIAGAVSPNSVMRGVSADGKVVAGTIGAEQGAFRWTEQTGMTLLGDGTTGPKPKNVTAVSGDGNVVVGQLDDGTPYKWSQPGQLELLPPRLVGSEAISFDGSIIFPFLNLLSPYGGAIRDASWDGSTIVGDADSEGYLDRNGIRKWIGDLPGNVYFSFAQAVSPDGEMIVGSSKGAIVVGGQLTNAELPIYWTEATGIVRLGTSTTGFATDISQPKIVIVGRGGPGEIGGAPFRWTPTTDTKSIEELLLTEGINVAALGWNLAVGNSRIAVSANGRIIVGTGKNPSGNNEPWLVELDIRGDFDADGDSDGNDFLIWQRGVGSTHNAAHLADWRANIQFIIGLESHPASLPVPEPGAALLLVAAATLPRARRVPRLGIDRR